MTNPTPQPTAPQPAGPLNEADDKLWASLAHFGGLLYILPSLIIYLVLKDRGVRTRVESKEALNWQITFLIISFAWVIISAILTIPFLIVHLSWLLGLIGFLIWVGNAVLSILGGVKVQQGGSYRYPFSFRFIK